MILPEMVKAKMGKLKWVTKSVSFPSAFRVTPFRLPVSGPLSFDRNRGQAYLLFAESILRRAKPWPPPESQREVLWLYYYSSLLYYDSTLLYYYSCIVVVWHMHSICYCIVVCLVLGTAGFRTRATTNRAAKNPESTDKVEAQMLT